MSSKKQKRTLPIADLGLRRISKMELRDNKKKHVEPLSDKCNTFYNEIEIFGR